MSIRADMTAEEFLPDRISLKSLRAAAAGCTACELYKRGTQTVFGEGQRRSDVVFVGEQPGDREDLAGHPLHGLQASISGAIVALGATAAQTMLGPKFKVTAHRGEPLTSEYADVMMATVHPSSILRAPDPELRREERAKFVDDMRKIAAHLQFD